MAPDIKTLIDAQKELLTHSYNSAMAYTNLILGAGYAGLFATWAFLRDRLTERTELWIALLAMASLLSFILFEVYKSFHTSRALMSLSALIDRPDQFAQRILGWEKERQASVRTMGRVWALAFPLTLLTGLAAGLVLMSAVIHGLWMSYL